MNWLLNKGRYKKIYSYERYEPRLQNVSFSDGTVSSIDVTKFIVDRQYYLIPGPLFFISSSGEVIYPTGEYEEQTYSFSSFSTGSSLSFLNSFSAKPIVSVEILSSSNSLQNVSYFLKNISSTGFNIEFSSEFSGSVKYRAIYSSTYPAIVERTPENPSSFYTASAGAFFVGNDSTANITYDALPSTPTNIFISPEDTGNNLSQVSLEVTGSVNVSSSTINISSNTNSYINFIVVK